MSSDVTRYCEKHGEWDQDVDDPYEESSQCEQEGIAPSQLRRKELAAKDAEIHRLREQLAAADESRRIAQKKIDKLRARVAELESAR